MKKWMFFSLIFGAMPLSMVAQDDDLYFVPSKQQKAQDRQQYGVPRGTYYSGSSRSVDDYNRRGSSYQPIAGDSLSDVIDFSAVQGVYPDSMDTDFQLTQQMSRFEGYEPDASYWAGYQDGRSSSWGWHSPWYYSWYDPWYYGRYGYYGWYSRWYDPWYYDWYYPYYGWGWGGWYGSWYYGGYYGWPRPYYYNGGYTYNGPAGSQRHGRVGYNGPRGVSNGHTTAHSAGTFGGRRVGTGTFGGSSSGSSAGSRSSRSSSGSSSSSYGNFGGSRSSSSSAGSRSYGGSGSSGGSFGGSRSSGGTMGGSRSGGGGSFGGRR